VCTALEPFNKADERCAYPTEVEQQLLQGPRLFLARPRLGFFSILCDFLFSLYFSSSQHAQLQPTAEDLPLTDPTNLYAPDSHLTSV
jgi:hypothetical protein